MRKLVVVFAALAFGIALVAPASGTSAVGGEDGSDDKVTGQTFVRHDGGSDDAIEECNDASTDPAADPDETDDDSDSNDGGSLRQNNEPYSVVDPTAPTTIVAGWNDYCLTDFNAGWEGFAFSRDSGETWTNSLVPGYPQDTSPEGMQSPLFGRQRFAGDPIAAFNLDGDLYVGGIAFNREGPINGDVFVATYGASDQANGYPVDYLRTRIVGRGTPSRNFLGVFQDKPLLEVDRTAGEHDGNVYVCWSRFTGFGQNRIQFSRSTDDGETFSRPISLSNPGQVGSVQGCDIAVESDGDVYVTYRTFAGSGARMQNGLAFNRSTDGGASFSPARMIRTIRPYFPFDGARDCGDGPFECPSQYVFHRVPLEPRVTADQSGVLNGVYLTYNAIKPGSTEAGETSYQSAGGGEVGQSLVYVVRTTDNGATWSDPVAVDPAATGHQYFPDIDALDGRLGVVWQDNRTDNDYSVQLPLGNTSDATSSGIDVVNTFLAELTTSGEGFGFAASVKVSSVSHQPQYEMFGDRDIPFQGDYNWISLASMGDGSLFGYLTWTDNRDVVVGTDPREETQDGFDVEQCREEEEAEEGEEATFGPDTCPNAGGLDQNVYGSSFMLP